MIWAFEQRWGRVAAVGVLLATLGLAACGRKGPLDLPPVAAVPAQTAEAAPGAAAPDLPNTAFPGTTPVGAAQPTLGRDGSSPTAPPPSGQRNRFFLDWLLD